MERIFHGARVGERAGLCCAIVCGDERRTMVAGTPLPGAPAEPGRVIFEIASITKLFTAVSLAELTLRREVRLDQPLRELLGDLARPPRRRGREIELRHLANHTSGLPRVGRRQLRIALRNRDNPYARTTEADVWAGLEESWLKRAPGKRFSCSNLGAGVLGNALARRLGADYERTVRSLICAPLGLTEALDLSMHTTKRVSSKLSIGLGWLISPSGAHTAHWHSGATGGFRSFAGVVRAREAVVVALANSRRTPERLGLRMLEELAK